MGTINEIAYHLGIRRAIILLEIILVCTLLFGCSSPTYTIALDHTEAVELTNGMTGEKTVIDEQKVLEEITQILNGSEITEDKSEDSTGYKLAIKISGSSNLILLNYDHVHYNGRKFILTERSVVEALIEALETYVE